MRIKKVSQTTTIQAQVVDGYSSSTNDSYSCNYVNNQLSNFYKSILWENDNPTSSITSDTNILLSNSDYDMILWLFRYSQSVTQIITSHSIKGYGTKVSNVLSDGQLRERTIEYNNDTSYTIKYYANGGALIPLCAIGIKTGLFDYQ